MSQSSAAIGASTVSSTTGLTAPARGRAAAEAFLRGHFDGLYGDDRDDDGPLGSERFVGGQSAADEAMARFDVAGYAEARNAVFPQRHRGASALSPYIRHGLLGLQQVWDHVADGPEADVAKFRNELLWQEYSRHWYARLGALTGQSLRQELTEPTTWDGAWEPGMACVELSREELEDDGWLVNQNRLWLAGHWTVRHRGRWQAGEDYFFRHLLDGSRAANRLGWQRAAGTASTKAYGFTRWQVEERAAGLCATCDLVHACPVEDWPAEPTFRPVEQPVELRSLGPVERYAGPSESLSTGEPDVVWLTAESLGTGDPALFAHPELPAVFVFDRVLLERLQLSPKRLVFLIETVAELAEHRPLEIHIGDPVAVLADKKVAVTYAPVPGFRRRAARMTPAVLHPWPWLCRPNGGSIVSFSAWLKANRSIVAATAPESP